MDDHPARQARHAVEEDGGSAVSPINPQPSTSTGHSHMLRSDHLSNLKPNVDSGLWVFGGASLDEPLKAGEAPKINGSVMLAQADTKEEVLETIRRDVYSTSGVWDESKVSRVCRL